jgi:hypothetical protein
MDKCLVEARGEWDSHSLLGKMVVDDCCLGGGCGVEGG